MTRTSVNHGVRVFLGAVRGILRLFCLRLSILTENRDENALFSALCILLFMRESCIIIPLRANIRQDSEVPPQKGGASSAPCDEIGAKNDAEPVLCAWKFILRE